MAIYPAYPSSSLSLDLMYMAIPNNLKQIRKACGLSQVSVAKKLGFKSSDRISKWEYGQMYPHMVNLLKLSLIYGVKVEELYPELLWKLGEEMKPKAVYRTSM